MKFPSSWSKFCRNPSWLEILWLEHDSLFFSKWFIVTCHYLSRGLGAYSVSSDQEITIISYDDWFPLRPPWKSFKLPKFLHPSPPPPKGKMIFYNFTNSTCRATQNGVSQNAPLYLKKELSFKTNSRIFLCPPICQRSHVSICLRLKKFPWEDSKKIFDKRIASKLSTPSQLGKTSNKLWQYYPIYTIVISILRLFLG